MTPLSLRPRWARRLVPLRRSQLAVVFLLAVQLASFAQAAPPGAALKKFEEGVSAFTANNFAAALQLFQASMELEPSPNTRFKIAKCYLAMGRTGSAYSNFRSAAKEAQDRLNATGEQRFAATQTAATTEAAQLESQVARVTLALPAELPPEVVAELTISLDGSNLPASILGSAIELDSGPHRANVSGPRIAPYEQGFEIGAGESKRLELAVVRRKAGHLIFAFKNRPAGLAVAIDAQPVAPNLVDIPITLGIGVHNVVVSAPGYLDFAAEQTLHDQQILQLTVNLQPAPRPPGGIPKAVTFVLGGSTLVLLGIGIGYGVSAQNTANEQLLLDPLFRDPTVRDGVRLNATIANVFFGLSGALAIATVGIAAATRWHTDAARPPKKVAGWLPPLSLVPSALAVTASEGEQ